VGGGKKAKRARKKFGRRKLKNEPPALLNCPWVSEDALKKHKQINPTVRINFIALLKRKI